MICIREGKYPDDWRWTMRIVDDVVTFGVMKTVEFSLELKPTDRFSIEFEGYLEETWGQVSTLVAISHDRHGWHLDQVDDKYLRFEPDGFESIMHALGDIYDDNVDVMSASEQAIIKLMQQGGSWADKVYEAMPDVVERLVKRATRPPPPRRKTRR